MINTYFLIGIFPNGLEHALVTPIFKQGDPNLVSISRPISTLPVISKIFEKCLSNQLLKFSNKYFLISTHQFGFQKGKTTIGDLHGLI